MLLAAIFVVGVASGAVASVVGFGIGSLLTPLLASQFGTPIAVAAVTIPHAAATAFRGWRLRRTIDWAILGRFGLVSAAGALAGALVYSHLGPSALTLVLGSLLVLTAVAQLTGWSRRWTPRGPLVVLFGVLSGFFGGVAGNQGGLRAAAMTTFRLPPREFVATATATGLLVDAARTPVYLWLAGPTLMSLALPIAVATIGTLLGTMWGERILMGLTKERFGTIVGVAVGALGVWLIVSA